MPLERILIVEDELPMRTALQDVLQAEGYRVLSAHDGQTGLKRAIEENPDLVLLDIMMPRLDGFAVCAELRRLSSPVPILKDVPMVGLHVRRNVVRQVSRGGFASADRGEFPPIPEVSCDAGEKYRGILRTAMGNHAGKEAFVRFCEAQMLWDASMAWNLIDFAEKNPDHVVVVMAGSFHSWKHGIPERVRTQSGGSLPFRVILPAGSEDPMSAALTSEEADYLVRSGA